MRRRLLTVVSVLSLVSCFAVPAIWLDGYWHTAIVSYSRAPRVQNLSNCAGRAGFEWCWSVSGFGQSNGFSYRKTPATISDRQWRWNLKPNLIKITSPVPNGSSSVRRIEMRAWGVEFWSQDDLSPNTAIVMNQNAVFIPWLYPFVFFFVTLLGAMRYRRRLIEAGLGRCQRCGYDIRATPQKCPECGTIPAKL